MSRMVRRPVRVLSLFGLGLLGLSAFVPGLGCGSEERVIDEGGCGEDCKQTCGKPLDPGILGSYTSYAKGPDGKLWFAGFSDRVVNSEVEYLYGDLVVGPWNEVSQSVEWTTVDGIPKRSSGCPNSNRQGWRGGETLSGDTVGLWTSLQFDANKRPMVSYYDATNHTLKIAINDGTWKIHNVVEPVPGRDAGRYAKLVLVGQVPVIAFAKSEVGKSGFVRSSVTLAKALNGAPRSAADWTLEDIYVNEEGECTAFACTAGSACIPSTGKCEKKATCTPGCNQGDECVTIDGKPKCEKFLDQDVLPYPKEVGNYVSVASGPNGLGIVAYDRIHGNLLGLSNSKGSWASLVIDGETGTVDTGDVGAAASLAIDAIGDWHVSYANRKAATLHYAFIQKGELVTKRTRVDDGLSLAGIAFTDGKHLVGADSVIRVDPNNIPEILYQDASAGKLRRARLSADKWTQTAIEQPGRFAGFFPLFSEAYAFNFWRSSNGATQTMSGNVSRVYLE